MELYFTRSAKWSVIIIFCLPVVLLLFYLSSSISDISSQVFSDHKERSYEYSYFVDTASAFDQHNIVSQFDKFVTTEPNKAPVDFGQQTYWHKLVIHSNSYISQQMVVLLDNPMIDEIWVYRLEDETLLLPYAHLGDKQIDNHKQFIALPHFNFEFKARSTETFVISSRTPGAANLPVLIVPQDDFSHYKDAVYLLWGGFIGIVMLMCIYNVILYLGVRDKLYLYYIAYIFLFLLELGVVHGYLVYLVPISVYEWLSEKIIVLNFLLSFTTIMFALHFLKYKEADGRIFYASKTFGYLMLVGAVASLFMVEYIAAQIYFLLQLILYGFAVALVVKRFNSGYRWAKFYFISWAPLFAGAAIGPLLLTGNLDYSFWTRHALLLGVMFEMSFISMALAERLKTSEQERLFQASHDHLFGIANTALLEDIFSRNQNKIVQTHTLLLVSVSNFEAVAPYLQKSQLRSMIFQLLDRVNATLSKHFQLLTIDPYIKYSEVAVIREDVFAFVLTEQSAASAINKVKAINDDWNMEFNTGDIVLNLNCTLAAAEHKTSKALSDSLNHALQALDSAINSKQKLNLHTQESETAKLKRIRLAADLQSAIKNNELRLYHQPQINLATNKPVGSETLVRWQHPKFGFVPPNEFVAIAEETGLIQTLSRWVFNEALSHLVQVINLGWDQLQVSINVSAYDIVQEDFINYMITTCDKFGLDPQVVTIELTETATVSDDSEIDEQLTKLREHKFNVAIDDFGTGYSSLTYVSKHMFNELKIDRQFVQHMSDTEKDLTIVDATIKMSKSLGLEVVAEGIETAEEMQLLTDLGCDYGQGYYIARPMPLSEYIEWLKLQTI